MKGIENIINENREALDSDLPSKLVWGKVDRELRPRKRRMVPIWITGGAIAASLVGVGFFIWNGGLSPASSSGEQSQLALLDTASQQKKEKAVDSSEFMYDLPTSGEDQEAAVNPPELEEIQLAEHIEVAQNLSPNVNCLSGSDGAINATIAGGTTPYTYTWATPTNGTTMDNQRTTVGSAINATTNEPGTLDLSGGYGSGTHVNLTPSNSVSATAPAQITPNVFVPQEGITLSVVGKIGEKDAKLNNPQGTFRRKESDQPMFTSARDATRAGEQSVSPGTYVVTVADANGCEATSITTTQSLESKQGKRDELRSELKELEQKISKLQAEQSPLLLHRTDAQSDDGGGLAGRGKQAQHEPDPSTYYEQYNEYEDNEWIRTKDESNSTFSIDVDQAAYTNMRRYINQGYLPPKNSIRLEEWLNYFDYGLKGPSPESEHPLNIETEVGVAPWNKNHRLVMIKMQAQKEPKKHEVLPSSNLVFLVDVSGSMSSANKLPLVQESMLKLVNKLREDDYMSIVTYAGSSSILLKPTSGADKKEIRKAIASLSSGGGTAGSKGIETAYDLAEKNLFPAGNNRVILATDGDWNIGITNNDKLKELIEEKRKSGIFLSVLGFGMGNLNDAMMEQLADNGNGNYAYVDGEREAERIFNDEFEGTMYTVAKDVKIQIEFRDDAVKEYRLIGYENRKLRNQDFDNDAVDAGDLGMGQNVIAFYEVIPRAGVEPNDELAEIRFRYKPLMSDVSKKLVHSVTAFSPAANSSDFDFASCVVEYGLCLRESEFRGDATMTRAIKRGQMNLGDPSDSLSYAKRVEFVGLMQNAGEMYKDYMIAESTEEPAVEIVKVTPNPATTQTEVILDAARDAWNVQLFNAEGALVLVDKFQNVERGTLAVSQFKPGAYIVKVYTDYEVLGIRKLVIQ